MPFATESARASSDATISGGSSQDFAFKDFDRKTEERFSPSVLETASTTKTDPVSVQPCLAVPPEEVCVCGTDGAEAADLPFFALARFAAQPPPPPPPPPDEEETDESPPEDELPEELPPEDEPPPEELDPEEAGEDVTDTAQYALPPAHDTSIL